MQALPLDITIAMHQLVRETVACLKNSNYDNNEITAIFKKIFNGDTVNYFGSIHKLNEVNKDLLKNFTSNYQHPSLNIDDKKSRNYKTAHETYQKAMQTFVFETIHTVRAMFQNPNDSTHKFIGQEGIYDFGANQHVTVGTGVFNCTITMGDHAVLIVEPRARDLEINLGEQCTVTLQHGVKNGMICAKGGEVNIGPLCQNITVITFGAKINVNEDPSAKDNSY